MTPLAQTIAAQRAAADPAASAFVSANAGSGKTRVLIDRVARLLLAGVEPARILCITFTKAAAAEMAGRLFELLGRWALADDETLAAALAELDGAHREPSDFGAARRLFARALETPGGLKIQTIHSFCEGVLKRFPLEAGVAPGFAVLEESEARALAAEAVDRIATRRDAMLDAALWRLAERLGEDARTALIDKLVSRQTYAAGPDLLGWDGYADAVARALGIAPGASEEAMLAAAASVLDGDALRRVQAGLLTGLKAAPKLANGPVAALLIERDPAARVDLLFEIFLTRDAEPRKKFGDASTKKHAPWLEDEMKRAQQAFIAARERLLAARSLADTRALLAALQAASAEYGALKAARAGLDYDDLITRVVRLFGSASEAAWVLHKLDRGVAHILLDEAQDTSPDQWRVVEGPLQEFFAGAGAAREPRSFFAVGDQKQSIYSFQGADASLFREKRVDLGKKLSAVGPFVESPLTLSFRTSTPVLSFVDALFADADARAGLDDEALRHGVKRADDAGRVEVWPLAPHPDKQDASPWDAPLDATPARSPVRDLANAVAGRIAGWLEAGETLASASRPIAAGDILILVQSRSALFHETIAALGRKGVPVAGADRLALLKDPAVEDLLCYARHVLLKTDDLSLAELLKSPFFGVDEDALFSLAHGREGTLTEALAARAADDARYARIAAEIAEARRIGLRHGAYAFFSHVLATGAPSGRRRLYARLGAASRDTIDEVLRQALEYELTRPRSLQGFTHWLTRNAGEIKRETDAASDAVRVMTVHGAKGLEAPIVFLLDAHKGPKPADSKRPLTLRPVAAAPRGLFALAGARGEDCAALATARAEARRLQYEEYRRLLYVAATRARDTLIICGVERGKGGDPEAKAVAEKTWHALAIDAFDRLDGAGCAAHADWPGELRFIEAAQRTETAAKTAPEAARSPPPPDWLDRAAPAEPVRLRLAPSHLADEEEAADEPAAYSPLRAPDRLLRGVALHRLLELLPTLAPEARAAAADRLLLRLAPAIDGAERARWRAEALAVLGEPAFAAIFSARARAEAAIVGVLPTARGPATIAGAVDRLLVEEGRVLIVDYKSNRPPPARVEDTPRAYLAQLAAYRALLQQIYPGRQIDCALLWTYEARLAPIPPALLDHAYKSVFL